MTSKSHRAVQRKSMCTWLYTLTYPVTQEGEWNEWLGGSAIKFPWGLMRQHNIVQHTSRKLAFLTWISLMEFSTPQRREDVLLKYYPLGYLWKSFSSFAFLFPGMCHQTGLRHCKNPAGAKDEHLCGKRCDWACYSEHYYDCTCLHVIY